MPTYPYALTITNPGAETGDTTGWTNVSGTLQAVASGHASGNDPRSGTSYFFAEPSSSTEAYTEVTLPEDALDDIDAGGVAVDLTAYQSGWTDDERDQRLG